MLVTQARYVALDISGVSKSRVNESGHTEGFIGLFKNIPGFPRNSELHLVSNGTLQCKVLCLHSICKKVNLFMLADTKSQNNYCGDISLITAYFRFYFSRRNIHQK